MVWIVRRVGVRGGGGGDEREAMFRLMAREVLGGGGEPKTSSRGAGNAVAGAGNVPPLVESATLNYIVFNRLPSFYFITQLV